ncbi:MAG TPA: hypothetical protein VJ343_01030 [archaeon]|nr:hypothetical protein [archaeon]
MIMDGETIDGGVGEIPQLIMKRYGLRREDAVVDGTKYDELKELKKAFFGLVGTTIAKRKFYSSEDGKHGAVEVYVKDDENLIPIFWMLNRNQVPMKISD